MNDMNCKADKDCKYEEKYVWRCTVCGYIYEDDPLPDHYICPQCGAPAPKFERIPSSEDMRI